MSKEIRVAVRSTAPSTGSEAVFALARRALEDRGEEFTTEMLQAVITAAAAYLATMHGPVGGARVVAWIPGALRDALLGRQPH